MVDKSLGITVLPNTYVQQKICTFPVNLKVATQQKRISCCRFYEELFQQTYPQCKLKLTSRNLETLNMMMHIKISATGNTAKIIKYVSYFDSC